jgi:16S rRNA (guanine1207-N2)-methyltransferase
MFSAAFPPSDDFSCAAGETTGDSGAADSNAGDSGAGDSGAGDSGAGVAELAPRVAERLLIDAIPDMLAAGPIAAVSCGSLGRGQLAKAFAVAAPTADVAVNFLDLHQMRMAQAGVQGTRPSFHCEPDDPAAAGSLDCVALPLSASGDAELTLDRLQAAHVALRIGGRLWAATDNPRDRWLRGELEKLWERVKVRPMGDGVVYHAAKTKALKKLKDRVCWFAFRDGDRLLRVASRPGVFSHRHLDTGARCLLETMEIAAGMRVFEPGCGAGPVACAAAARAPDVHVFAIDSNPRAVQCARWSAAANGLSGVTVALNADGDCDVPGSYDLALANPPYYSHGQISRLFIDGSRRALRSGGVLLSVTKDPGWYLESLPPDFADIEVLAVRAYFVIRARRR